MFFTICWIFFFVLALHYLIKYDNIKNKYDELYKDYINLCNKTDYDILEEVLDNDRTC